MALLSLFLDMAILLMLGLTIFYAYRLSSSLAVFRAGREDMSRLIKDLSTHIDKAHAAIEDLQDSARRSGHDLQKDLKEAKEIADELDIMIESGNNLANRLEKASRTSRGQPDQPSEKPDSRPQNTGNVQNSTARQAALEEDLPSFFIKDKDAGKQTDNHGSLHDDSDDDVPHELQSEAEKELFAALQKQGVLKKPKSAKQKRS